MKVLFATGNKGNFLEVEKRFSKYGVEVVSPDDLPTSAGRGFKLEVPETGRTLEANASTKVRLYAVRLKSLRAEGQGNTPLLSKAEGPSQEGIILMADDTGLEIDALGGEPGVKMRRWKDGVRDMTDEEIIEYCLERMEQVPPEARGAVFRTVIAILFPGEVDPEYFDGRLRGVILRETSEQKYEGLPFDSLFYIPDWEMMLGETRRLPENVKEKYLTHWEIAVDKVLERVLEWG